MNKETLEEANELTKQIAGYDHKIERITKVLSKDITFVTMNISYYNSRANDDFGLTAAFAKKYLEKELERAKNLRRRAKLLFEKL